MTTISSIKFSVTNFGAQLGIEQIFSVMVSGPLLKQARPNVALLFGVQGGADCKTRLLESNQY